MLLNDVNVIFEICVFFSDSFVYNYFKIAPPATRLVDFQFHWKLIQNFYLNDNECSKVHVDNTKIPLHLHQMLQVFSENDKIICKLI